jgi:hypothetical protein
MNKKLRRKLLFNSTSCFKRFRVPRTTLKLGGPGFFKLSYQNLLFLFIVHHLLRRSVTHMLVARSVFN